MEMSDDEKFECPTEILELAKQIKELTDMGVALIKPEIDAVIHNRIKNKQTIERLLDRLLDYAGMSDKGLALFKRLCRYYYPIDPRVTAEYIYIYRDLYDSDEAIESGDT
jgi:alkyl hydroperoxide reductase subunit AhpC